jgi:hypothetical protein
VSGYRLLSLKSLNALICSQRASRLKHLLRKKKNNMATVNIRVVTILFPRFVVELIRRNRCAVAPKAWRILRRNNEIFELTNKLARPLRLFQQPSSSSYFYLLTEYPPCPSQCPIIVSVKRADVACSHKE